MSVHNVDESTEQQDSKKYRQTYLPAILTLNQITVITVTIQICFTTFQKELRINNSLRQTVNFLKLQRHLTL